MKKNYYNFQLAFTTAMHAMYAMQLNVMLVIKHGDIRNIYNNAFATT